MGALSVRGSGEAGEARSLGGRPRGAAVLERGEPPARVVLPLAVALVEEVVREAPRPARRQQVVGQVGIEERELAPLVHELRLRAEDGLGAARTQPPEPRHERAIRVGDGVEVPRPPTRRPARAPASSPHAAATTRAGSPSAPSAPWKLTSSAPEPSAPTPASSRSRSACGEIHRPPPSDPKPAHASRERIWWRTSRRSSGTRRTTSSQRPSHAHGSPNE